MRSLSFRSILVALSLVALPGFVRAQTITPAAPPPVTSVPAPTTAAAGVEPQDTADAKLAVVLRSYSLLQDENDKLRAELEKLTSERASIEAQLNVAKSAMPLADQATALREQLRQMQDQLAALSTENNQLKTKLALLSPSPSSVMPAPSHPGAVAVAPAPAPVIETPAAPPAPRTHVIALGDTLSKISKKYYGTADRWTEILAANRDVLKNENSLVVGRTIKIP